MIEAMLVSSSLLDALKDEAVCPSSIYPRPIPIDW